MQFYDAHIHYFYEGTVDSVKKEYLSMDGFLGAALLILEKAPSERELLLQMVPGSYHDIVIPGLNFSAAELVQLVNNKKGLSFIPYLDIRFFRSEDLGELKHYVQNGYKGIKILYVPEKDESLKVDGWERSLERTVPESERFVADIVAESERLGLPVLFHVDLNRYNEYACELFSSFPNVFFDIPHFGSSRKKMAEVLSRYPNCYTLLRKLRKHIRILSELFQTGFFLEAMPYLDIRCGSRSMRIT